MDPNGQYTSSFVVVSIIVYETLGAFEVVTLMCVRCDEVSRVTRVIGTITILLAVVVFPVLNVALRIAVSS